MVIKGTVHNGQIQINNSTLPEGTEVLITPIHSNTAEAASMQDLSGLKVEVQRIASLASESRDDDGFSGADHDRVLYGK